MTTKVVPQEKHKMSEIDENISKIFDIKKRLGKGAYGIVWKALDKRTNETVAVKKIFDAFRDETDAQRTFREITFLKAFRDHPNIVTLLSVYKAINNLDMYLVFEYMESDLHNIIKKGSILKDVHKRYVMYQLVNAIKYIHSGNVIHRDLKPSNILIDSKCRVKLADFGLARSVSNKQLSEVENDLVSDPLLTDYVATRWYRAPEILVASKRYTKGIDMWSLGCILGEMLRGKPLFQGSSTINQIEKIITALPPITEHDVNAVGAGFGSVLLSKEISTERKTSVREILYNSPPDAIDLVESLLLLDPLARLTAKQALRHSYIDRFRNSINEEELKFDVLPSFRDDVRLTVPEYRSKLYEIVNMPTEKPNYRAALKKATKLGNVTQDSKLIINWEKHEAMRKQQKSRSQVHRGREDGREGRSPAREKHTSGTCLAEQLLSEAAHLGVKSRPLRKGNVSPTLKRRSTKAHKQHPPTVDTPKPRHKSEEKGHQHAPTRVRAHSVSLDTLKEVVQAANNHRSKDKRYSLDAAKQMETHHTNPTREQSKGPTKAEEQSSLAMKDMKWMNAMQGFSRQQLAEQQQVTANVYASSNLRNAKSEQLPKPKVVAHKPAALSTTDLKPQQRICYEERLKKLEEEIEKYKKEVKSFCQQTMLCTKNKQKSDLNLKANRSKIDSKNTHNHTNDEHDCHYVKETKAKRSFPPLDSVCHQSSGGSGDHVIMSKAVKDLPSPTYQHHLPTKVNASCVQKPVKTNTDYSHRDQRFRSMGKYF